MVSRVHNYEVFLLVGAGVHVLSPSLSPMYFLPMALIIASFPGLPLPLLPTPIIMQATGKMYFYMSLPPKYEKWGGLEGLRTRLRICCNKNLTFRKSFMNHKKINIERKRLYTTKHHETDNRSEMFSPCDSAINIPVLSEVRGQQISGFIGWQK